MTKQEVAKLYLAMFQRAPEGEGLNYWLNMANQNNWDTTELANEMAKVAVNIVSSDDNYKAIYPQYAGIDLNNLTLTQAQDIIDSMYQILFGKDKTIDPDGVNYWANLLLQNDIGTVVNGMIDAAEQIYQDTNHPAYSYAKAFVNKVQVSVEIADILQTFDGDFAKYKNIVSQVDSNNTTISSAKGKAILLSWGETKVKNVMKDLPLALSGSLHMWKIASAFVHDYEEGYLDTDISNGDISVKKFIDGSYNFTFNNKSYHSVKDYNGDIVFKSTAPDYKDGIAKTAYNFSLKNIDRTIKFEFKDFTDINITAPDYSANESPFGYKGNLKVNNITTNLDISHFDENQNLIDSSNIKVSNVTGNAINGYSYSMFDANLQGQIEIDGKTYTFKTENLTVNDWKDPDWTTQYWEGTHLNEMVMSGKVYLTDESGDQLEFDYLANNPDSITDDHATILYNGMDVGYFDLIL